MWGVPTEKSEEPNIIKAGEVDVEHAVTPIR